MIFFDVTLQASNRPGDVGCGGRCPAKRPGIELILIVIGRKQTAVTGGIDISSITLEIDALTIAREGKSFAVIGGPG